MSKFDILKGPIELEWTGSNLSQFTRLMIYFNKIDQHKCWSVIKTEDNSLQISSVSFDEYSKSIEDTIPIGSFISAEFDDGDCQIHLYHMSRKDNN